MRKELKLLFPIASLIALFIPSFLAGEPTGIAGIAEIGEETASTRTLRHDDKEDVDYYDGVNVLLIDYHDGDKPKLVKTVYSDEIFFKPSTEYHHLLAKQSLGMASCATRLLKMDKDEEGELEQDGTLFDYFYQNGFDLEDIRIDDYLKETSMYTVATAIAHKEIENKNGDKADLVAVAIRGAQYKNEWESNLTVDVGLRHEGFDSAATLVKDRLYSYISQHDFQNPIKIWMTGFSRAGAISNIASGDLVSGGRFTKEQVYSYNFAAPAGVWDPTMDKIDLRQGHENIFNILGASDPIPRFVPGPWDYGRFGVDKYLPGAETNSNFDQLYAKVQQSISELGGITNYNVDLNLRVRLIFGMLMELAKDEYGFTEYLQPILVKILTNPSVNNILPLFRETLLSWHSSDPELTKKKDALIDFAIATIQPLLSNSGYMKGKRNSISNPLKNLAHEHNADIYFYFLHDFSEEELYQGSNQFAYIVAENSGTILVKEGENEVIRIENGRKTLTDYAKTNQIDLSVTPYGNRSLLALPFDREYEVSYSLAEGASMNVCAISYGMDYLASFKSFDYKLNSSSPRSGGIMSVNSGIGDFIGDYTEINPFEFANYLAIANLGLSYEVWIYLLMAIITIILGALAMVIVLIASRIFHFSYPLVQLLLGIGILYGVLTGEAAFWLVSELLFVSALFKLFASLCILGLYLYKRDFRSFKKPWETMLPFFLLGLTGNIVITISMPAGLILFILALAYLIYYYFRSGGLTIRLWIIYAAFALIATIGCVLLLKDLSSLNTALYVSMFPEMLLAFFLGLKRKPTEELSFFFIFAALIILGLCTFGSFLTFALSIIEALLINLGFTTMAISDMESVDGDFVRDDLEMAAE